MSTPNNPGHVQNAPKIVGLPGTEGNSEFVHQHYEDTCAVRSQELILRDFGISVSEDTLRSEAISHGWYTPGGGTDANSVGNLLELHGVAVNRYENANIYTLTSELAKGHKVIIGVDSGELWDKGVVEGLEDKLGIQGADHALIVSGIDTSDPDHVKVVLTDPGTGDIAKEYPMEQFIDAWKDSNCFMVTTAEPAPAWLPEMKHFDYELGHLESIGNLSYDTFEQNILPLSNDISSDQHAMALLTDDFSGLVNGDMSSISPELADAIAHIPSASHHISHFPETSEQNPDHNFSQPHHDFNDPAHPNDHNPTIADLIHDHDSQTDFPDHDLPPDSFHDDLHHSGLDDILDS
ncbi:hypothetical protein Ctha_2345 [Chloroherpeton thalassium ATCC 35110]|uniref:Peptidase C39-like domain-containing protein n=2 Tax=Chloroherpeton thalassium TaxID=100716 RepID=B3QWN5_CHLT3|nr:hypothetical protein Ctha_2345 [Chloroherpeton thalassium ATCC 35110]